MWLGQRAFELWPLYLTMKLRVIGAFLLAPLTPSLIGLAGESSIRALLMPSELATKSYFMEQLLFVLSLSAVSGLFAFPAAMLFGVPVYFLFHRLRWVGFWQVVSGGVLAASAFSLAFACGAFISSGHFARDSGSDTILSFKPFWENLGFALVFLPYGAIIGAIFWFLAFWRRAAFSRGMHLSGAKQ